MQFQVEYIKIVALLGAGICMGVASLGAALGEGITAGSSSEALMRQPKSDDKLLRTMLISQAITESGAIFGLVIALLLLYGGFMTEGAGWIKTAALFAASLAVSVGSLGPNIGTGYVGSEACKAIGRNPNNSTNITTNMLVGQALAQTDAIFALVISLLLFYTVPDQAATENTVSIMLKSMAYMGAAFAIGIGTMGAGNGIGYVAGKTTDLIGKYPKNQNVLMRTMFLGAAITESCAIYSLVIALLLIFVV